MIAKVTKILFQIQELFSRKRDFFMGQDQKLESVVV